MNDDEEDNLDIYKILGYISISVGIVALIFGFLTLRPVEGIPFGFLPHSGILFTFGLGFISVGIALLSTSISIKSGEIAEESKDIAKESDKKMKIIADAEIENAMSDMMLFYDKLVKNINNVNVLYINKQGNAKLFETIKILTINAFVSSLAEFRSTLRILITYREYINIYEHELVVNQSIKNIFTFIKYLEVYISNNKVKIDITIEESLNSLLKSFINLFNEMKEFNCYDKYEDVIKEIVNYFESKQPYINLVKNRKTLEKSLKKLKSK